jgi:RNA polymerase sigma-70 factor (ECF subfamily)
VTLEQELLSNARSLDQRVLAEIYDCYSPRLYRYAFRLLGDECLAEDCVAETFSRFLGELNRNRGPHDHLQAYLFRTAHNLVVDRYRKAPLEDLDEDMEDSANVEVEANLHMRQQEVRRAIHQLSSSQQQVIALKFWEGWENEDIAQVLHKPIGAIKSLQHRALVHLQKVLFDEKS